MRGKNVGLPLFAKPPLPVSGFWQPETRRKVIFAPPALAPGLLVPKLRGRPHAHRGPLVCNTSVVVRPKTEQVSVDVADCDRDYTSSGSVGNFPDGHTKSFG